MEKFDQDFLLGAATAAHQVEGNNIHSDYWAMEQMEHTSFVEPSLDAVDHYHRYEEDIRLMKEAGLNAYRFSVEWARIEPEEGRYDEEEAKHYQDVIDCCIANGIEPIVTLHHFTSPKWLIGKGGWEARSTIADFERYTRYIMGKIGSKLHYVCTINEANMGLQVAAIAERYRKQMMAQMQAAQAAGKADRNTADGTVQVGMNLEKMMKAQQEGAAENKKVFGVEKVENFTSMRTSEGDRVVCEAHVAARNAIKELFPQIQAGLTLSLHDIQPVPGGEEKAAKMWEEEFTHYLPYIEKDDFLGVQNYTRSVIGPDGQQPAAPDAELTQMNYEFYPEALEHVIRRVAEAYHGTILVTENGIATADDSRRIEFIRRALEGVQNCMADGLLVKGYMYWSLMDNFEWQKGYSMTFGLIAVDRSTQTRQPKESLRFLGSHRGRKTDRNVKELIAQMTLEEKAGLCSGKDFWHTKGVERMGIPSVMVSDGPHGLRKSLVEEDHTGMGESIVAVCFPAASATAASFDTELIYDMGETLGEECQAEELSILLGPAVNIKRSPLCGRNFEYFSEDPYLTGQMAASYIRGVQKWDVGTSMKHFAANNQEYYRMSCSSEVSDRTLREIYLPAFEKAVKESQPKTIMCSYNKINGTYASENRKLLTDILRDEWGFEGYVMTDWGAVADRVKGIRAGLDLEMPGSGGYNDQKIVEAVQNGTLDESLLDIAVERILKVVFSYADHRHPEAVFDRERDHQKAVDVETECAVLLQNNGILPLTSGKKVAYIGEFAQKPRYQGGGSSHINSSKVVSALEAAEEKNRNVTYTKGFPFDKDEADDAALAAAVEAAKAADVAVIFAGLPDVFESEGYDRKDMKMPECQNRLIAEVAKVQPNTVVVLHNGSPVEAPWADDVAAILELYLGGQGVGEACDRLLYGEANPCGHLPETFPYRLEDNPSYLNFPGDGRKVTYAEGIYVGYRYYETKKIPVRWAFGHGLSYTTFEMRNLVLPCDTMKDTDIVKVSVDVVNTGDMAGKEVVQLYVADRNHTPNRPVKELKGFTKVALQSGEKKTVTFALRARDLSFYHEELKDWYAPSGTYEILVGDASDHIMASGTIRFETSKLLPLHVDGSTTLGELFVDPRTAPVVSAMMEKMKGAMPEMEMSPEGQSETDKAMIEAMISKIPLKTLVSFGVPGELIEQMIMQLNGQA